MSARRRAPRPIRHIVLYGTLRAGYKAHARLRLRAALAYVGKCVLGRLDAFEGYDARNPDRSPYVRAPVRVHRLAVASAGRVPAWIYVFNGVTTGRRVVPGGAWRRGRRSARAQQ